MVILNKEQTNNLILFSFSKRSSRFNTIRCSEAHDMQGITQNLLKKSNHHGGQGSLSMRRYLSSKYSRFI